MGFRDASPEHGPRLETAKSVTAKLYGPPAHGSSLNARGRPDRSGRPPSPVREPRYSTRRSSCAVSAAPTRASVSCR
jgi:hypothetical protein